MNDLFYYDTFAPINVNIEPKLSCLNCFGDFKKCRLLLILIIINRL